MNIDKLELIEPDDPRLTPEQAAVAKTNNEPGLELYLEVYSEYAYLIIYKPDGFIKRINETGHDVWLGIQ